MTTESNETYVPNWVWHSSSPRARQQEPQAPRRKPEPPRREPEPAPESRWAKGLLFLFLAALLFFVNVWLHNGKPPRPRFLPRQEPIPKVVWNPYADPEVAAQRFREMQERQKAEEQVWRKAKEFRFDR